MVKNNNSGLSLIGVLIIIGTLLLTAGGVVVWRERVLPISPSLVLPTLVPTEFPSQAPMPTAKSCVPRHWPCEQVNEAKEIWYYSEKDNLCQKFDTIISCEGSAFATKEECESACVVEIPQRTEMKQGLYGKIYAKNCMPPGPHAKGLWHGKATFSRVEDEKIVETIETMVEEGNYKIGLTEGAYRVNSSQGTIFPRQIEVQKKQWREQDFDICTSF